MNTFGLSPYAVSNVTAAHQHARLAVMRARGAIVPGLAHAWHHTCKVLYSSPWLVRLRRRLLMRMASMRTQA